MCQLLFIACISRLRSSRGNSWHWHNVTVVMTSVVVVDVVVVVVEEKHCMVMVMRWWLSKLYCYALSADRLM